MGLFKKLFRSRPADVKPSTNFVTFYAVAHPSWGAKTNEFFKSLDEDPASVSSLDAPAPLSYLATKQEAEYYCNRFFRLKYDKHFKLWCSCHDFPDPSDPAAWDAYQETLASVINPGSETDLAIFKVTYSQEQLARILRLSSLSLPVGAPWEDRSEISIFKEEDFSKLSSDFSDVIYSIYSNMNEEIAKNSNTNSNNGGNKN